MVKPDHVQHSCNTGKETAIRATFLGGWTGRHFRRSQSRVRALPVRSKIMGVSLRCPKCRAKLTVPDKLSGRSIVCPLCATRLKIQVNDNTCQAVPDDPQATSAR